MMLERLVQVLRWMKLGNSSALNVTIYCTYFEMVTYVNQTHEEPKWRIIVNYCV